MEWGTMVFLAKDFLLVTLLERTLEEVKGN